MAEDTASNDKEFKSFRYPLNAVMAWRDDNGNIKSAPTQKQITLSSVGVELEFLKKLHSKGADDRGYIGLAHILMEGQSAYYLDERCFP